MATVCDTHGYSLDRIPCIITLALENFHDGHGKCCIWAGELTSVIGTPRANATCAWRAHRTCMMHVHVHVHDPCARARAQRARAQRVHVHGDRMCTCTVDT